MKIELVVKGMTCNHCVASVKSVLEEIDGVSKVDISLEKGLAFIDCNDSVSKDILKEAIDDIGFEAE